MSQTQTNKPGSCDDPGVAALRRLYSEAQGDFGQCRHIARFLLGLYNGKRYPFDPADLRGLDDGGRLAGW